MAQREAGMVEGKGAAEQAPELLWELIGYDEPGGAREWTYRVRTASGWIVRVVRRFRTTAGATPARFMESVCAVAAPDARHKWRVRALAEHAARAALP